MTGRSLTDLEAHDGFIARHLGCDAADVAHMLDVLGVASLDALLDEAIPESIRLRTPLALPGPRTETDATAALRALADRNTVTTSLIGRGYAGTITPPVILRNVFENPAWYTAYTPYQPEIAQGRLEVLLGFQTMVADLTGMPIANASMLDEGTAAAEAMTLCRRVGSSTSDVFVVDADCHPQTIDVVRTRAEPLGIDVVVAPVDDIGAIPCFGALLQYPGSSGAVRPLGGVVDAVHASGGLVVVAADLLALTVLEAPGTWGADAVVGSSQRFGVPMGFGGPHAGFLAVRDEHKRSLPGRLVGMSVDAAGRPALRLALQTREQHIRREKATSNICTAQVLLAVIAALYAAWHGPDGLRRIAERVHRLTAVLAAGLRHGGIDVVTGAFFDTITVSVPGRADAVLAAAADRGVDLRRVDADTLGIALDETTTRAVVADVWAAFGVAADVTDIGRLDAEIASAIPAELARTTPFLTHEFFADHHTETEMLRYLRRLADRDFALDRGMIPLGSCTMKLNATAEMQPVSWPEFAALHPFGPAGRSVGYREMIAELEAALAVCTGYDAVSVQPNAGSQGELAGLLAIRAYHRDRGDHQRTVCLIPSSAHGTNAASAVMAGMRVVVVKCDDDGNVDLGDLEARAAEHADDLAAVMITYPSTHGVYEATVGEICELVHRYGGQVYVDGANLNAMVGVARPGAFGADVSHLNLHKTFCIPHGGGGPGVGPVAVRSHLAPYLPGSSAVPAISAAPFGSASILPISWMYVTMMGADGLTRATTGAILAANYVAARLGAHYPVLYRGASGRVAHECILDIRPLNVATGVTVDDIAKRLIDHGFHAPTVSFPVAGTLMVEPTESESLAELDRFCDAMIAIRHEIDHDLTILQNAPHTAEDLLTDTWERTYARDAAAFPAVGQRRSKYWPPVSRIDGAYGDRNLVCSCQPVEAYAD
jgi:glycine dehydrogenase